MIICLDVGATEIKVALLKKISDFSAYSPTFDCKSLILRGIERVKTDADKGKDGILAALKKAISLYLVSGVEAVAISSAGTINEKNATITYATENLPGMTGFDYRAFIKESFDLPVAVLNDGHAALLGEVYFGAAKGFDEKSVAMLTFGSGVGGGYFKSGRIVADETNDYARFGHICLGEGERPCTCGKIDCIETYLSGRALHRDAEAAGVDGADTFKGYALGVEKNVEFVELFKRRVKRAFDLISVVSPFDLMIIGGGVVNWIGDDFEKVFEGLSYPVVKARLLNGAGVFGAYAHYLKKENLL